MKDKIRLMIVDDHGLLRLGLKALFKYEKDITLVAEAADGVSAVRLASETQPDVILLDLQMPEMDGVEAARRILETCKESKILILTSFGTTSDVTAALSFGAVGAITKDTPNDELPEIIRRVHAGETILSSEIRQTVAENTPAPSNRQLEILNFVARGLSSVEIAKILHISANAVDQHITACCKKLNAANRTEAVAIALKKHLLKI